MCRKLFVAGLASLLAARVPSHLLLFRRIGDPFSRVDDIGRVTEVEDELLGVGQVPLDLLAESQLESEVSLRLDLRDLGLLFFELPVLLFDESILRAEAACGRPRYHVDTRVADDMPASCKSSVFARAESRPHEK